MPKLCLQHLMRFSILLENLVQKMPFEVSGEKSGGNLAVGMRHTYFCLKQLKHPLWKLFNRLPYFPEILMFVSLQKLPNNALTQQNSIVLIVLIVLVDISMTSAISMIKF